MEYLLPAENERSLFLRGYLVEEAEGSHSSSRPTKSNPAQELADAPNICSTSPMKEQFELVKEAEKDQPVRLDHDMGRPQHHDPHKVMGVQTSDREYPLVYHSSPSRFQSNPHRSGRGSLKVGSPVQLT